MTGSSERGATGRSSNEAEFLGFQMRQLEATIARTRRAMAVALILAVGAGSLAGYLWFELDNLESRTEESLAAQGLSLRSLDERVDNLDREIGTSFDLRSLAERLDAIEGDIGVATSGSSSLDSRVDSLENDMARLVGFNGLEDLVFDVADSVDDLRDCVNVYMKTVGDAGGRGYTYYLC